MTHRTTEAIEVKGKSPGTNINVSVFDDEIVLSVWILRAHSSLDLTPEQAKQLIEAIQTNLDYLQSTEEV